MSRRAVLAATLAVAAAGGTAAAAAERTLQVWVSILPQRQLVERIAGSRAVVEVLVPPGRSPETYEPSPRQMARLADADLLITIGVPIEHALLARTRDLMPDLEVVDGTAGIDRLAMAGSAGEHGHGDDPHIWLDPVLLTRHAATITDALCRFEDDLCPEFRTRLEALDDDLAELDRRMAARLGPFAGRELFVYHPTFGYLARRYGLVQVAIESDGKAPSPRQLADLIDRARRAGIPAIFVQPQFSATGASAVARAIGCEVVELDPLAPDLLDNLGRIADRIAAVLGARP